MAKSLSILGLTGPIGCGKSTVGRITVDLGALDHIDADEVVHDLMQPETELTAQIVQEFGSEVLLPTAGIDRRRLGEIVFRDSNRLRRLEGLVHPGVRGAITERVRDLEESHGQGVVTVEAIRLLDSPLSDRARWIWLVQCESGEQRSRLMKDRMLGEEEAAQRMGSEPDFDLTRVDEIIRNDSTLDTLRTRVREAWRRTVEAG